MKIVNAIVVNDFRDKFSGLSFKKGAKLRLEESRFIELRRGGFVERDKAAAGTENK